MTNEFNNNFRFQRKFRSSHPLRFPLICSLILMINSTEIRHDDGNGKGDDQHSTERANTTNDLSCNRFRHLTMTSFSQSINQNVKKLCLPYHRSRASSSLRLCTRKQPELTWSLFRRHSSPHKTSQLRKWWWPWRVKRPRNRARKRTISECSPESLSLASDARTWRYGKLGILEV